MTLMGASAVFLTSLLALPISYVLNSVSSTKDQGWIFLAGLLSCFVVVATSWLILRNGIQKSDAFFYALSLLTYRSVQSLVIALENDGVINGFVGMYLREGEPYLKTAHGTMLSYLDGIGHYSLYLMMLAALSWNQRFSDVGLYWSGSYGYSSLILVLGVFMGKDGIRSPLFLHMPFIALWLWSITRFVQEKKEEIQNMQKEMKRKDEVKEKPPSIWKRPIDLCLVLYFSWGIVLTVFRFVAVFGESSMLGPLYATRVEPYLMDPSPFPKAQCLVHLMYFVPYYGFNIAALLNPGHSWLPVWSLVFAGAVAQGQVTYSFSSFHYRTPFIHRVPQALLARTAFWVINGSLALVPHLMMYRAQTAPQWFLRQDGDSKAKDGGDDKKTD